MWRSKSAKSLSPALPKGRSSRRGGMLHPADPLSAVTLDCVGVVEDGPQATSVTGGVAFRATKLATSRASSHGFLASDFSLYWL